MTKQKQISLLVGILLLTGLTVPANADKEANYNNTIPMINETETTGAFGSNETFTLKEEDITDKVIQEDLTDKAITEVEQKFDSQNKPTNK